MSTRRSKQSLAFKPVLLLLFLLAAVVTARSDGISEAPGNPKAGRDLFVSKGCIRCHSIFSSAGKRGPNLAPVGMGRNLYELCASVWSHWSKMNLEMERDDQPRPLLSATEFRDIVSYLYYVNYNSEPGDAGVGRAVFASKGCGQCHATEPIHGKDKPGRAVYEMAQFQDAITLAVAVWNHGTSMSNALLENRMQWPEFQDKEVVHLVAYIRSRNAASATEMSVPGDPQRGHALFAAKSCLGCHKSRSAVPVKGPEMASSGRASSLSSLIGSLWNHYPNMSQAIAASGIAYPKISKEEMQDLLAYVYWVKAYGLEGRTAAGRALYESKQCASCHSAPPGKKASAPNLVGADLTRSVYSLLAAIWNHGPKMDALLKQRNIEWPVMTGEQMRDLAAFLRSGKD
jgi:cytochrome c2